MAVNSAIKQKHKLDVLAGIFLFFVMMDIAGDLVCTLLPFLTPINALGSIINNSIETFCFVGIVDMYVGGKITLITRMLAVGAVLVLLVLWVLAGKVI